MIAQLSLIFAFALVLNHIYLSSGIISGTLAVKGQFPHVVKILFYHYEATHNTNKTKVTRYLCTGSILNKQYVVTAAGCFERWIRLNNKSEDAKMTLNFTKYTPTYIRGGVIHDRISQEPGFQERRASKLIVHPSYQQRSTMFDVDVALLAVSTPWNLNQDPAQVNVAPRLAKQIEENAYVKCIIAGFGFKSPEDFRKNRNPPGSLPEPNIHNLLYYYMAHVGPERYCMFLRRELDGTVETFDDFYVCARPMNTTHRQGTCYGDTGAALICDGLLTGILSQTRARRPCDNSSPNNTAFAVFTSVGADEVTKFLREYISDLPPYHEVPAENPWDEN